MTDIAAIHREILEGAWSGGSQAVIDERYSDDYTFVGPLGRRPRQGRRAREDRRLPRGVPRPAVHRRTSSSSTATASRRAGRRWARRRASSARSPPTGRSGEAVTGVSIARFEGGKLAASGRCGTSTGC